MCGTKVRAAITRVSRAPTSKIVALNLPTVLLVWERDYQGVATSSVLESCEVIELGPGGWARSVGRGWELVGFEKVKETARTVHSWKPPGGENLRVLRIVDFSIPHKTRDLARRLARETTHNDEI